MTKKQVTFAQTIQALCQDIRQYPGSDTSLFIKLLKNLYTNPSLAGVFYYRIGNWLYLSPWNPLFLLAIVFYRIIYPLVRLYSGVELSPCAQIEPGLCIMHFGPTIIHRDVIAVENLTLFHGVTIGSAKSGIPRLGSNVSIGAGATVIGGIKIGNNVLIGAGSVVTKDLPDNSVAVGVPATIN